MWNKTLKKFPNFFQNNFISWQFNILTLTRLHTAKTPVSVKLEHFLKVLVSELPLTQERSSCRRTVACCCFWFPFVCLSVFVCCFLTKSSLFVMRFVFMYIVSSVLVVVNLVVSISAVDCLERLVSKLSYYVSSGMLTPSMPAVPNCCCSKGLAPYWSNPPFLIFDIRALWRSVLSARAPKCQKLKMVGYTSMALCKALTGLAVKGSALSLCRSICQNVGYIVYKLKIDWHIIKCYKNIY